MKRALLFLALIAIVSGFSACSTCCAAKKTAAYPTCTDGSCKAK